MTANVNIPPTCESTPCLNCVFNFSNATKGTFNPEFESTPECRAVLEKLLKAARDVLLSCNNFKKSNEKIFLQNILDSAHGNFN